MDFDQAPLKYVPVARKALFQKSVKPVSSIFPLISGLGAC